MKSSDNTSNDISYSPSFFKKVNKKSSSNKDQANIIISEGTIHNVPNRNTGTMSQSSGNGCYEHGKLNRQFQYSSYCKSHGHYDQDHTSMNEHFIPPLL